MLNCAVLAQRVCRYNPKKMPDLFRSSHEHVRDPRDRLIFLKHSLERLSQKGIIGRQLREPNSYVCDQNQRRTLSAQGSVP